MNKLFLMEEEKIINEVMIKDNLEPMKNKYNILRATVKIIRENAVGSGFFLKFEKEEKLFYCLVTCEHVITSNITQKGENIIIRYENDKKELKLELNNLDRMIYCLEEVYKIDATIIQIIDKDGIDDSYFLLPNLEYNDNYKDLTGQFIQVPQFPGGKDLCLSKGRIIGFRTYNDFLFFHDADTEGGSSGSPIVIDGTEEVIGIHKGSTNDKKFNIGIVIGIIYDIIIQYKKNGPGREYYKNGDIKYDGNFKDDEYDGDGTFFYEDGKEYIGQFKNGKRHGNGCIYKDGELIKQGTFDNDELIYENENENKDSEEEKEAEEEKEEKEEEEKEEGEGEKEEGEKEKEEGEEEKEEGEEEKEEGEKEKDNKKISIKEGNYENKKQSNTVVNNENIINNSIYNNKDYNDNINNNDNYKSNKNNIYLDIKKQAFHILHPIGNLLGIRCKRCGHPTKSHEDIGYGSWKCIQCDDDDNICEIVD